MHAPEIDFPDVGVGPDFGRQAARDQAAAIEALLRGLNDGEQHQVLLGVTGSGKTFTMAKVMEAAGRPALVLAHNIGI